MTKRDQKFDLFVLFDFICTVIAGITYKSHNFIDIAMKHWSLIKAKTLVKIKFEGTHSWNLSAEDFHEIFHVIRTCCVTFYDFYDDIWLTCYLRIVTAFARSSPLMETFRQHREKWDMKCFLRLEHLAVYEGIESFTRIPRRYLPLTLAPIIKLSFYHDPPLCESFFKLFYLQCGFYVCV